MPWKISSLLQTRERFIRAALRGNQSVAFLCRQAGISRKTGFKWLRRFREFGGPGLRNRARRPHRSPNRTAQRWISAIGQIRRRRRSWGAKKIYAYLRAKHPRARLPKVRTIAQYVVRLKLICRRRCTPAGPALPMTKRAIAKAPNDIWTVDFKGWFRTGDGQRVDPLTVRDLFSRYILGVRQLAHRHEAVQRYFQRLFGRFGLPKIIRVDHGAPFAGDGALELSRLSAWWLRLGIGVEFTRRAKPQDNGAHEQMHRVFNQELVSPAAATAGLQQRRTNRWVYYYNFERPHEAINQRTPATLYHRSRRRYPGVLPELKYPPQWQSFKVLSSGYVRWRGRLRVIGRAFGGERIGIKPSSTHTHEVYFGKQLIGVLVHTDPVGIRPAQWKKAP